MSSNKTRIKIPHTKWSVDIVDEIMFPIILFGPIVASLLLASIFGFEALYVIGFVMLSYMLVTGINFVTDEENKEGKEDH